MDINSLPVGSVTPILISLWIIYQLLDRFVFSKNTKNENLGAEIAIIRDNHLAHIAEDIKNMNRSIGKISVEQNKQGNRLTRVETLLKVSNPSP